MITMLNKIIQYTYYKFLLLRNPTLYAKKVGVNIKGNVYLYGAQMGMFGSEPWLITLGDNVHITGRVQFINHDGAVLILRKRTKDLELTFPIVIGNNVFIGFDTKILPGVNIGDNVIIGAGSVVNKDIPSNTVAAGVPCKVIKTLEEYEKYAIENSLKYGDLSGAEKDKMLRKHYNYEK